MHLCAEAKSVEEAILEIGNTNNRYHFFIEARRFNCEWNSRFCSLLIRLELDTLPPKLKNQEI